MITISLNTFSIGQDDRLIIGRDTRGGKGFTLLELMVVMFIIAALASIAIPRYAQYRQRAQAAVCLSNRYNIDMAESAHFLEQGEPGLAIDESYKCPSGGVYVWIISDPKDPGYPKVTCSVHGEIPAQETDSITSLGSTPGEIIDGMVSLIQDFYEKYGKYPRSWGDYRFTDIGLDPEEWSTSYDGIIYTPMGESVTIEPDEGFTLSFTDAKGREQELTSKSNWNLIYSIEDDKWYYKKINKNNVIDISTLRVEKN